MAFTWEPRWEKIRIEAHGIIIHTCRDKITGMIACPICIDARSKCFSENPSTTNNKELKKTTREETGYMFFFTAEDLILHIRDYHAHRLLLRRILEERK
ncbi:MAG: hypothetical protein ABWW65_05635 [Thermoprotei archaeon]